MKAKHDPKRDLAYERFKQDKFVTTDYFFTNTQKLSCTANQTSLYYSLLTNTILTNQKEGGKYYTGCVYGETLKLTNTKCLLDPQGDRQYYFKSGKYYIHFNMNRELFVQDKTTGDCLF